MKTIGLLSIVCSLFISAHSLAQVKMGFKAGGNLCNMKFDIDKDYGEEPETKFKMGYHFGLITDITLMENTLSLQPGLLFTKKGYSADYEKMLQDEFDEYDVDMDDYEGYVRVNYNYLEIPVSFAYKFSDFQVFAGPYFAFGIGGSFKHDFSFKADGEDFDSSDFFDEDSYKLEPVFGEVDEERYEDFLDDDDVMELYRAFDWGMNLGIGYQIKSVLLNINYGLGLGNMTPKYDVDDIDDDYTENVIQKNRVVTFSVSYFFN